MTNVVIYFSIAAAILLGPLNLRSEDSPKPAPTPRKYPPAIQASKLAVAHEIAAADRVQIFLLDYKNESKKKQFMSEVEESGMPVKEKVLFVEIHSLDNKQGCFASNGKPNLPWNPDTFEVPFMPLHHAILSHPCGFS